MKILGNIDKNSPNCELVSCIENSIKTNTNVPLNEIIIITVETFHDELNRRKCSYTNNQYGIAAAKVLPMVNYLIF